MELHVSVQKTLEISVGGSIEKTDITGINDRITGETGANSGYKRLVIDLSGTKYMSAGTANLIMDWQQETMRKRKAFEVRNAYGQAAHILDDAGIKYCNEL
jgi:3-deoxy-D-manno-octulosonic acid (KDO) 8-phosphate synthase